MIDHLSIQCSDLEASARFYDAVFEPLGYRRVMEFDGAIGYGAEGPDFWIGVQTTGAGFRESHIAFRAPNRAAVREFFGLALREGADALHEPRLWPEPLLVPLGLLYDRQTLYANWHAVNHVLVAAPWARQRRRCSSA